MMNINSMYYFKVLAEYKHYAKAAEQLNIAQSTLSYTIDQMEKELGVPLFEKKGRNIDLTKYGSVFYSSACIMLDEYMRAQNIIRSMDCNIINFGITKAAATVPFLTELLRDFQEKERNARVIIKHRYHGAEDLLSDIRNKTLDCCMCMNTAPFDGMVVTKVYERRICALALPSHALARMESVKCNDLLNYPLIVQESKKAVSHFAQYCQRINPDTQISLEKDKYNVVMRCARGDGIGIMETPTTLPENYGLKAIMIDDFPRDEMAQSPDIFFVYKPFDSHEKLKRQFVKYVKENYAVEG